MKALSIQQPWAWLIIKGIKDIENRSWVTRYRGKFLVHASLRFDLAGYNSIKYHNNVNLPEIESFCKGGIIGEVEIVDCVSDSLSKWFSGPYGFVLVNPKELPFSKTKGKLGFFEVTDQF
jgi:hypothetical protein